MAEDLAPSHWFQQNWFNTTSYDVTCIDAVTTCLLHVCVWETCRHTVYFQTVLRIKFRSDWFRNWLTEPDLVVVFAVIFLWPRDDLCVWLGDISGYIQNEAVKTTLYLEVFTFWHSCGCRLFKSPPTRTDFTNTKYSCECNPFEWFDALKCLVNLVAKLNQCRDFLACFVRQRLE